MIITGFPFVFSIVNSSIEVNNWATILLSISLWAPPSRFGVMASISSKKTRHGAKLLASSNKSLIFFSLSPDIPLTTEGAEIDINGTCNSPANALAIDVLPQPGGPCNRTPLGGSTPVDKNISG
ncbi:hypothetical protein AWRI1631_120220 [Saccharomyces cerevisiae AWRI1631]|uniref:Uncharacterized protein n=1 Tax=Saccharomyces cerevisiae (strain AWRI1631) TaxID=545124 RepID=B5VMR3_YEAS6|nr:hypothetical protein AWRI1631_120220 [Saccharomyces cerevisiae AWRI1631]